MPIEIRELVIRAAVEPPAAPSAAALLPGGEGWDVLVRTCVDEILRALRRAQER